MFHDFHINTPIFRYESQFRSVRRIKIRNSFKNTIQFSNDVFSTLVFHLKPSLCTNVFSKLPILNLSFHRNVSLLILNIKTRRKLSHKIFFSFNFCRSYFFKEKKFFCFVSSRFSRFLLVETDGRAKCQQMFVLRLAKIFLFFSFLFESLESFSQWSLIIVRTDVQNFRRIIISVDFPSESHESNGRSSNV